MKERARRITLRHLAVAVLGLASARCSDPGEAGTGLPEAVIPAQDGDLGQGGEALSTGDALTAKEAKEVEFCNRMHLTPIFGTSGDDVIKGSKKGECIIARGGQDTVNGGGGNDFIFGDDGDDTLRGGDGDDLIFGGAGQDELYGGAGKDTLNGEDGDDELHGEAGNDVLSGGQGQDALFGGPDNDLLVGGPGDDTLSGDEGDNALRDCEGHNHFEGGSHAAICQVDSRASSVASCSPMVACPN